MSLHGILRSTPFITLSVLGVIILSPMARNVLVAPLLPASAAGRSKPAMEPPGLESKLAAALQETAELKSLLRDLRSMHVSTDATAGTLAARILGSDPRLLTHAHILDCGMSQGVAVDSVATHSGCLVGFIEEVRPSWSLMSPLDSPDQRWVVDIVALDGRPAPTEGWPRGVGSGRDLPGGGRCVEVLHVSATRSGDIRVGDAVITSGSDFRCPKGLLAGHVASVRREDLFLRIEVTPSLDPGTLRVVLIQPPPPNPFRPEDENQ
ncbi:MAG: rod shape-determining protein MreC [Planctomycetota bacterium]